MTLRGAQLTGTDQKGDSSPKNLQVKGDVFLDIGFTATGAPPAAARNRA